MHFQREIAVHCCIITKDRDSPPDMSKYSDWFAADPFPATPHSYESRTACHSISLYKTHLRLYAIWNHAIKCYLNQWDKTVSRCWRQLCRLTRGIHVSHVQFIESVALKRKKNTGIAIHFTVGPKFTRPASRVIRSRRCASPAAAQLRCCRARWPWHGQTDGQTWYRLNTLAA